MNALDSHVIAAQCEEAAKLLEVLAEDPQRIKALQRAARQLETFEGDINALAAAGQLETIPGIGPTLASEISALQRRLRLPLLDELYERVPAEVRELFGVSGLGAKKIASLWQQGIGSMEALLAACEDGRLATLKGFGAKSVATIAASLRFRLAARSCLRLDQADTLLQSLQEALPALAIQGVGAWRRRMEVVEVLELVISGADLADIQAQLKAWLGSYDGVLSQASQASDHSVQLEAKLEHKQLRFYVLENDVSENGISDDDVSDHGISDHGISDNAQDSMLASTQGAALLWWTGNADYRTMLQQRAQALGFSLSPTGLWDAQGQRLAHDEAAIIEALELAYLPPELREHPEANAPEQLLRLEDLRGVVHNHSTWSDGQLSLPAMAQEAQRLGFSYFGIADHSRSSAYASGLSLEQVAAQAQELEALRAEFGDFGLLHGVEVDILKDGSLDYPDEVLAGLDYCVVSVHQHFQLSQAEQTKRLIRAVQNPYASILGHLSGRLLLKRPGYDVDIDAVLEACADSGTVVEINANPRRLDLDWRYVARAKALGCRFAINPDAHSAAGFQVLRYGVDMARKGALSSEDVVNCAPDGQSFLQQLKPR